MPDAVHEIELDQSIYGKAKIILRRKDGTVIKMFRPKWDKRWDLFNEIYEKWQKVKKEKR